MWEEIQDMQGEIFDIREEDLMAVFDDTMKEDFDQETKKLLDQCYDCPLGVARRPLRTCNTTYINNGRPNGTSNCSH